MLKYLFLMCCFFCLLSSNALAQGNELSFIVGGGKLSDADRSVNASAFTAAYTRRIYAGLAAEGSLDVFFVKVPGFGKDDFGAAQIAVVYHFRSTSKNRSVIPYLTAGIGRITTDFTEIPSEPVYRLGGGVKYYFKEDSPFGLRIELRDEITRSGGQGYPLTGSRLSLVSLRAGLTWRF